MSYYEYYKVGDSGVETIKDRCPNCDLAFLADHEDRKHCGKCGYSEEK